MMMMVEILTQTLTVMVKMNRNQNILTKKNILLARRGVSSVVVGVPVNVQRALQGQKLSFLRIVKTFTVLFPASRSVKSGKPEWPVVLMVFNVLPSLEFTQVPKELTLFH